MIPLAKGNNTKKADAGCRPRVQSCAVLCAFTQRNMALDQIESTCTIIVGVVDQVDVVSSPAKGDFLWPNFHQYQVRVGQKQGNANLRSPRKLHPARFLLDFLVWL